MTPPSSEPSHPADRLDGWKEIAVYLGRDVTTVIRWERERALPVHRLPGVRRSSVHAFSGEIDAWLGQGPAEETSRDRDSAGAEPARSRPRLARTAFAAAAMLLLAVAAVALLIGGRARPPSPARVELRAQAIVAFDASDRELWTLPFDGPLLRYPWLPPPRVIDVDGDGQGEVVATVDVESTPGVARGELLCLDGGGRVRWRRTLEDEVVFGAGRFGPPWQAGTLAVYATPEGTRIAWSQVNAPSWPGVVLVFDAAGRRVGRFVHSGAIYALQAMAGATGPLVVGGGVSNSQRAAALFVLDGRAVRGHSQEPVGSSFECLSCDAGAPLRYLVFPPSELSRAVGAPYNVLSWIGVRGTALELHTEESLPPDFASAQEIFLFTREIRFARSSYSDSWVLHDELQKRGRIHHSAAECPMYRTAPVALEGDPVRGWLPTRPAEPALVVAASQRPSRER